MANFVQSWKAGKAERPARIGFATPELPWQVLTARRWNLLKVLPAWRSRPPGTAVQASAWRMWSITAR